MKRVQTYLLQFAAAATSTIAHSDLRISFATVRTKTRDLMSKRECEATSSLRIMAWVHITARAPEEVRNGY